MSDTQATERFRTAIALAETGIDLMRQNLRRRHPDATPDEIEAMLRAWRSHRLPDAPGRVITDRAALEGRFG